MADLEPCPGDSLSPVAAETPVPAPVPAPPAGSHRLAPGARIAGVALGEPLAGGPGHAFAGVSVSDMARVVVRAQAITPAVEARRKAWEKLIALPPDRFVTCTDAFEEEGWRYEVIQAPELSTLREWISCHKAGLPLLERLVGQLTEALAALHDAGVVHLALSPDCIFVQPDAKLEILIGGLDEATLIAQDTVNPSRMSLLYAPPEAFSIHAYQGGPGLCAWDWWSVGRILQEFVLGKHVMSLMFNCDVLKGGGGVSQRAEALMQEREPPSVRAGAVEVMPDMPSATETLLKGLLTSPKEGRWGATALRQWLSHKPTPTQYDLPTSSRLFSLKGFGCTAVEAAEAFATKASWDEGVAALVGTGGKGAFAAFLEGASQYKDMGKEVGTALAALGAPQWAALCPEARNDAVAAVAWQRLLATKPQKPLLQVRGRRLDGDGLIALLSDLEIEHRYDLVRALLAEPFRSLLGPGDAETSRLLLRFAETSGEALARAQTNGWLREDDREGALALLRLVLEPEAVRSTKMGRLRAIYGGNRDPFLARVLSGQEASPWADTLLLFTSLEPERFGFVDKAQWEEEKRQAVRQQRERARAARLGRSLERLFRWDLGVLSGAWGRCALAVAALAGLGAALHKVQVGAGIGAGLVGFRLLALMGIHLAMRAIAEGRAGLPWRSLVTGCRSLPDLLRDEPGPPADAAVPDASEPATEENPGGRAIALMPSLSFMGAAAWLLLGALALSLGRPETRLKRIPALASAPSLADPAGARSASSARPAIASAAPTSKIEPSSTVLARAPRPLPAAPAPGAVLIEAIKAKLASGEYEMVNDGFGAHLHGPLKKWALHPQGPVPAFPVKSAAEATGLQNAEAIVNAEMLLEPYGRRSVVAYVAVPVPARDGLDFVLVNGREHTLADPRAFTLQRTPAKNEWYQVGSRRVVYLGIPDVLAEEMASPGLIEQALGGGRPSGREGPFSFASR